MHGASVDSYKCTTLCSEDTVKRDLLNEKRTDDL